MKHLPLCVLLVILLFFNIISSAQTPILSNTTGNFEIDGQIYKADSAIDAPEVPEKFLNNAFLNLKQDSTR